MADSDYIDLDLTTYKDRSGQQINPGRYRFVVQDAEVERASTGNQMIVVWLRVLGGAFDGAVVLDRLVYTDKSLFRIVNFMQALGLPTPLKRLRVDVKKFVGRQVDGDVEDDEPYMGRVKSVVRGYMRVVGEQAAVADLDALDQGSGAGLDEFAPATTDNPAPAPERVAPEAAEAAAMPEPEVTEAPEEVDLDSLDLG